MLPVSTLPETSACWNMSDVRVICTADAVMYLPCISTQLSVLSRTDVLTPGFTRNSWQALSSRCCDTCKSLIGAERTDVFRCPHSQKSTNIKVRGPWRPVNLASASYPLTPKSLVQVLSDSGEETWWCPVMQESRVLSLMKKHMYPRVLVNHSPENDGTPHLLVC
jgi:hypothetical protein